jgi:hypothetical protein
MNSLRSATSKLRKLILIGWALAVVWIYLGNLVNFHQHHIWGKQLIPVAYSSTRVKEKESASFIKNSKSVKSLDLDHQFDFSTPDKQVVAIPYFEFNNSFSSLPHIPLSHAGIQAFSFRGPPTA